MKSDVPLSITLPAWEGPSPLANRQIRLKWQIFRMASWLPATWFAVLLIAQGYNSPWADTLLFFPKNEEQWGTRIGHLGTMALFVPFVVYLVERVSSSTNSLLRLASGGLQFEAKDKKKITIRLNEISRVALRIGEMPEHEPEPGEVSIDPNHFSDLLVYPIQPHLPPFHISFQLTSQRKSRLVRAILRQWQAHGVLLERATEHAGVAYNG